MNIGQFKNVDGRFLGSVATATLHLPRLGLRPVESDNPRAPAFEIVTLNPGDVIVTGTPGGVGARRQPPVWMKPGDVVEIEVDRVGVLRNRIVAEG